MGDRKSGKYIRRARDSWKYSKSGRIVESEKLVAQAGEFDLMSNVFMSVALDDAAACQHVLRILTGI